MKCTVVCRNCLFSLINRKILPWILSKVYRKAKSGIKLSMTQSLSLVIGLLKWYILSPFSYTKRQNYRLQVLVEVVIRYRGFSDSIVTDQVSLFTFKFWSSIYYYLNAKRRLGIAFHPQIDGQTERKTSTIEAGLKTQSCLERDDWVH